MNYSLSETKNEINFISNKMIDIYNGHKKLIRQKIALNIKVDWEGVLLRRERQKTLRTHFLRTTLTKTQDKRTMPDLAIVDCSVGVALIIWDTLKLSFWDR